MASGGTAASSGIPETFTTAKALWGSTGVGFKNYASATGLTASATAMDQDNATNRALGVRQTSAAGFDPGASFIFVLANTTGKNNLKMDFQLQSLDITSTRTTTWSVDYALGENPAAFTPATATGTLTTGGSSFSNNAVSVTLPSNVNNQSQKVWIRIITKTATTGSSNRASTGIDDVKFTWN